ncbi:MAG: hypothetical protein OQK12_08550 [Motiliproteus sp.]|nr:hypothetical protein [Motiliproteus sp.]MCW9051166.1 hypothetical protein [Motiliproteus sp.]
MNAYLKTLAASSLLGLSGLLVTANSLAGDDPIASITVDANSGNNSVWAITKAGRLKWCRSAGSGTECIAYQPDSPQVFVELAERGGDGGSSVWALTKSGQLMWCRPEGLGSIACYP